MPEREDSPTSADGGGLLPSSVQCLRGAGGECVVGDRPGARLRRGQRVGSRACRWTANFYQGFMNSASEKPRNPLRIFLQSFSSMNPAKQLAEINTFLVSGVDALVVLALTRTPCSQVVTRAHDKGVLFISYANRIPGDDNGFIKWADKDAGKAVGERIVRHIKEKLGGKANVGFLTWLNIQVVTDRMEFYARGPAHGAARHADLPRHRRERARRPEGDAVAAAGASRHQGHRLLLRRCGAGRALGLRQQRPAERQRVHRRLRRRQAEPGTDQGEGPVPVVQRGADIGDIGRGVIDIPHGVWTKAPEAETHVLEPYVLIDDASSPASIDTLLKVYGS